MVGQGRGRGKRRDYKGIGLKSRYAYAGDFSGDSFGLHFGYKWLVIKDFRPCTALRALCRLCIHECLCNFDGFEGLTNTWKNFCASNVLLIGRKLLPGKERVG